MWSSVWLSCLDFPLLSPHCFYTLFCGSPICPARGEVVERGEKTPTPKIAALLRKRPVLLRANFALTNESCLGGGGLFPSSKVEGQRTEG